MTGAGLDVYPDGTLGLSLGLTAEYHPAPLSPVRDPRGWTWTGSAARTVPNPVRAAANLPTH